MKICVLIKQVASEDSPLSINNNVRKYPGNAALPLSSTKSNYSPRIQLITYIVGLFDFV